VAPDHADAPEPELKVVDRRWWAQKDRAPADTPEEASGGRTLRKPSYVEDLERQLAEKDAVLQEYLTKYKDAAREFDAVKARMRRDVVKDIERGKRIMLVELLEVVDNLDRAIGAARQAAGAGALVQGVEMVRDQFLGKLAGFGVTRMAPLGRPFDLLRHEAASLVPTADPGQDNVVLGVIREGYEASDEVLRPALVAVGRLT
jgi:molecular chaperone GrpE